jgi:hypothetical protein
MITSWVTHVSACDERGKVTARVQEERRLLPHPEKPDIILPEFVLYKSS